MLNILVICDLHNYFDLVFYIIFSIQILYFLINFNNLTKLNNSFIKISIKEKIIIFFTFLFFLISILPLSDADSISVMQNSATFIYQEGLKDVNLNKDIEFTSILGTEILLIISPILNSDNFGVLLNLFVLIFFITFNLKKKTNFFLILFSSPLILYFISTAKLQLFFGILYLILFIIINQNLIKNRLDLFITILLLTFYASGKTSYILLAAPLYLYLFYTNLNNWKNILSYSIISFIIILLPIFIIKQIYFANFFAPFFDNIIGKNNEFYNGYALSLRSSQGWLLNFLDYKIYLKPFISLKINEISSSLGLIFLLFLVDLKLLKKTKFFPFVIISLVLLTGQILPRYYFEAFLIMAYYYNSNNIFFKPIVIAQGCVVLAVSIIYIYISYVDSAVIHDKSTYMRRFSHSYYNAEEVKKLNLIGNILDVAQDRPSIFFDKNLYSFRNLSVLNQINGQDMLNLNNYIKENLIDYIIAHKSTKLPVCLNLREIGEIYRLDAKRNFLKKNRIRKFNIFSIDNNKC